ncbi:MAG: division plane positioning ATPase MipZ [Alphaproteobacteria bacterium]
MITSSKKPYIIVLGNEKGGSGKSTTAMHVVMALLDLGFKVASIDVDARQGTLSRYVENRIQYMKRNSIQLPMPDHCPLFKSEQDSIEQAQKEDEHNFSALLKKLKDNDFIVIDTPGSDLYLSNIAHSYADTIITPLNDSFVDLDVMVHLKPDTLELDKPSIYANRIWEQKKQKAIRERASIDWIVLRNRLSNIHSANKQKMEEVLTTLSKRLAFRCVPGFSERVIFREMFLSGLTLLDLKAIGIPLQFSHIAAKQELRNLMEAISVQVLREKVKVNF